MRLNQKVPTIKTHEGGVASRCSAIEQLKRSVLSCMLWEDNFYEDGQSIAERIKALVPLVPAQDVSLLAIAARTEGKLRHVPLLLARELARTKEGKEVIADTLGAIIQRPDELTEFLATYWSEEKIPLGQTGKRSPLANQVKKGLANAFGKFNEYQLAKYNRQDAIKLRDVLFLSHAKPKDDEQAALWKRLIDGALATPDTWEVELSKGSESKIDSWTRLLKENKLGGLAMLRNLRNMQEAGVDKQLIQTGIETMKVDRVLPYRFVTAARYAPQLEPSLEVAMLKALEGRERIPGKTVLMVDVSGSMDGRLSGKSEMTCMDAACGLAILARELCEDVEVWTFSNNLVEVPLRRGFALRDAINQSQQHSGTYLGKTLDILHQHKSYDRIIVFTDEQTADRVPNPKGLGYIVNVAAYQNGVGYGAWRHINGFSEAILDYITASEALTASTNER
jgi:60 kDa SS-A/Ro ribonucleoprotein